MTDEQALLAAVLARPEDDLCRLVYADFLEERGDKDRADFIRVNVASKTVFTRRDHGITTQTTTDGILLERHGQHWVAPLAAAFGLTKFGVDHGYFGGTGSLSFEWSRGFVSAITAPLAAFWQEAICDRGLLPIGVGGRTCQRCNGRGCVSGPSPAFVELCRREPVERVTVSDRQPGRMGPASFGWFANRDQGMMPNPADDNWLPWTVAAALSGTSYQTPYPRFERHEWSYPSAVLAHAALSAALLAEARATRPLEVS